MPDTTASHSAVDRRPAYGAAAALPVPTDPQRERMTYARRLAFLEMLARPADGGSRRSSDPRSMRGSASG